MTGTINMVPARSVGMEEIQKGGLGFGKKKTEFYETSVAERGLKLCFYTQKTGCIWPKVQTALPVCKLRALKCILLLYEHNSLDYQGFD